jgi:glycosyltransferase involved in cell wall biosynthesis
VSKRVQSVSSSGGGEKIASKRESDKFIPFMPTHKLTTRDRPSDWAPTVTAILPCYRAEAFISRTLASLAAQTWPNLDILIGDDASPDGTLAVVKAFAQGRNRVRIIERTQNLGWLANTNDLMAKASGELMFFALHDDVVAPTYVERLVNALHHNPRAVLAYSDVELFEVDGTRRLVVLDGFSGGVGTMARTYRMARRVRDWWLPNRGLFYAEAFQRIGGIQRHDRGEFSADWPWLLHMATLGEFERVPEPLCQKFWLKTSLSRNWKCEPEEEAAVVRSAIREIRRSDLGSFSKAQLTAYLKLSQQFPDLLEWIPQPLKDLAKYLMN